MVDEPAFTPLLSVCTELPTPACYLDTLWLTRQPQLAFWCGSLAKRDSAYGMPRFPRWLIQ